MSEFTVCFDSLGKSTFPFRTPESRGGSRRARFRFRFEKSRPPEIVRPDNPDSIQDHGINCNCSPPQHAMKFSILASGLLACLSPLVSATALTYKLGANEKACFFSNIEAKGAKIAFYFAVQAGGAFDVDYEVTGPFHNIIMDGQKERQGDFVFTATEVGEYSFCFNNQMSTFAEKFVDFEIAVENEARASLPAKQGTSPEQTSALEESIFKLSGQLSTITRNQKYFRTRENRNFSTVRSTERRIFNFSVIESLMMVCMAGLQVFIVRFFFQGARKGYV
ncbi:hypothetical protein VTL71DRAFT_5722 [Oculimacula yallundae]|uniref:GOLD domain-containing protein n=1 Tax=Oculimacula yallundae TaxID=86028 RepID=A0ABR4BYC7_9HELO